MYEKSFWFIWISVTLFCAYLGYTMPPVGSFANTLTCTVISMVVGGALGFLVPIGVVIFVIAVIIYAVFRLLL